MKIYNYSDTRKMIRHLDLLLRISMVCAGAILIALIVVFSVVLK
jgi:hypothetical protein